MTAPDLSMAQISRRMLSAKAEQFTESVIVEKFERTQGVKYDPEREITICCGSTEAMMSAMMAIINPGDEIVVFEPFYENYGPDAILSGATPRFVKLRTP